MIARRLWSLKSKYVALAASLALAVAVSSAAFAIQLRSGEPSSKVEIRAKGPSGQPGPVEVIVPNYPDDTLIGEPEAYGAFRLLPYGHQESDPVSSTGSEDVRHEVAWIEDASRLESTGLLATIGYVPAGFVLTERAGSLLENGKVVEIIWRFEGDHAAQIDVIRGYRTLPVDIQVPPVDSFLELAREEVNGEPAVFLTLKPGEFGPQIAYFVDEALGVVTVVVGDFPEEDDLLKVVAGIERSSK